jgi:Zn finger protein HypA/HybF involved in hydrogenase expression
VFDPLRPNYKLFVITINMAKSWTNDQLAAAVKSNTNFADVARSLGLVPTGKNGTTIKRYIELLKLDMSHFTHRCPNPIKHTLLYEEVFCENSKVRGSKLARRLKKLNIFPYQCECGNTGVWNNKPLTLHVDHKDGTNSNNLPENLRWLCPNCHSQTPTYARTKFKKLGIPSIMSSPIQFETVVCHMCNEKFQRSSRRMNDTRKRGQIIFFCSQTCSRRHSQVTQGKQENNHDEIYARFKQLDNYLRTAREFNVSDRTVHKIVKKFKKLEAPTIV